MVSASNWIVLLGVLLAEPPIVPARPAADVPTANEALASPNATEALAGSRELLTPLPSDSDLRARLRQELGAAAQLWETDHFLIAHRLPGAAVRDLALRLEAVYRANVGFARELEIAARRPARKLAVLVYPSYEDFRADPARHGAADDDVLGFYDPTRQCSVFFDLTTYPPLVRLQADVAQTGLDSLQHRRQAERLRRNTQTLLVKVVQHEAAHQVLDQTGVFPDATNPPTWLVEGTAQMFEVPFVESGASLELSTNRYRLTEFTRLHDDPTKLMADLRRMISDDAAWRRGEDYSLSWALVNYLYKRQRERLAAYWRLRATPETSPATAPAARLAEFERLVAPIDDRFVARFEEYLRRLRMRFHVAADGMPRSDS